ncbi:MAG: alcohol dehydrogenase catalytic domain-containing protein [Chloroflexi bacterium]|nr:alcohol dehydrogenase catalytic domain-containing protein [Chloroflexota bacterium]
MLGRGSGVLAVRAHEPGTPPRLEEVPRPEPSGSEVLVRVGGCGVCHTDLHIVDGTQDRVALPVTLGHEVAGWVEAAGPGATDAPGPGTPVVVFGGWGCGSCRECAAGAEQRCAASSAPGFQADGGYAEWMLVPHARHLVPLTRLEPARAAPLADAGVTPYRAVRRAEPWLMDGARVLVIGAGALGQFAIQYLRTVPDAGSGLTVAAVDLAPGPLTRARELGADHTLMAPDAEGVRAELGGPADVVLDLVGADETLALASGAVASDGLVLLVGEAGGSLRFGFDGPPVEAWFSTVAWGSASDLRDVVRLAETDAIQWRTETMPLEGALDAHARLRAGSIDGRLVLVPGG